MTHEHAAGTGSALRLPHPSRATGPCRLWTAIALAAITLPALTLLLVLLGEHVDLALALVLYLLTVVVIALVGGLVHAARRNAARCSQPRRGPARWRSG
ncbi:hypothetical protein [Streptomyces erythrochromogenes]|uniref:hypothetical protein n=1 Tax=Streptomyces erythrochromogenes TaxID=285574 RepID=UPI0037F66B80